MATLRRINPSVRKFSIWDAIVAPAKVCDNKRLVYWKVLLIEPPIDKS